MRLRLLSFVLLSGLFLANSFALDRPSQLHNQARCNQIYHPEALQSTNFGLLFLNAKETDALPHEISDSKVYAQVLNQFGLKLILFPAYHGKSIPSFDGVITQDDEIIANYSHKNTNPSLINKRVRSAGAKIKHFNEMLKDSHFNEEEQTLLSTFFGSDNRIKRPTQIAIFLNQGSILDYHEEEMYRPILESILNSKGLIKSISITQVQAKGFSITLLFTKNDMSEMFLKRNGELMKPVQIKQIK